MPRPIPPRLKRLLLPLWNGGHRAAWRAGEYLGAVANGRFERCSACGRFGPMLYRRWVIPPELERRWGLNPRLAAALARKESSDCARCGAKLRSRRLAATLLEVEPGGMGCRSLDDWVRTPEARALQVAEINRIDGLHETLAGLPGHHFSDYLDGAEPGDRVGGVRHEDLMSLTYPDDSFDLVLTSETLEHVPDLDRALAEIRRVLKPGGRHLFTIPLLPGVPTTFARARLNARGEVEHHATPISHPGGDRGYPVFTEFGADILGRLRLAGFQAEMRYGPPSEADLGQVFATRKV